MTRHIPLFVLLTLLLSIAAPLYGQDAELPPARVVDAEPGGVQTIVGEYFPSTPSVRDYGSQPIVFLGDISNIFDETLYDFSTENLNLESPQVLAYTEGDIRFEPLRYEINLPIDPGGVLTDIDRDNTEDRGIGVYTVNFTFNGIGSPFIDDREFIAFSSTTYSTDFETLYKLNGGRMLVYADQANQGFPASFGDDGLLFTDDDPLVALPVGYTVVDLDTDLFTFIRSNTVEMNIRESEGAEFTDFSDLSYTEAFDEMVDMMRREYAFTNFKGVDWDTLYEEYAPLMAEAEANNDSTAYARTLDGFLKAIPDGHVGSTALGFFVEDFFASDGGGVGMALAELDNGSVIVTYLLEDGPAANAGIALGAEVISINGTPITEVIDAQPDWFGPHSTPHNRRLEQVRFAARFSEGEQVTIEYRNVAAPTQSADLTATNERDSLFASPFEFEAGSTLPVDYEILDSGYGYVTITSFSDDNLLSLLLWERAIRDFIAAAVPGVIIDMRVNGGGSPDIANVMLGYLFDERVFQGTSAFYFEDLDEFAFDPLYDQYVDPASFYYPGEVAVLVGPTCYSACEFFTYALTLREGVTEVVGFYPTGGLGGGIKEFAMPEGISAQFTVGRAVGTDREIHIEGTGVVPTVDVPLTLINLLVEEDAVLDAAIMALAAR